jgi:hypothetical protein
MKELKRIQAELKAPKGQRNQFGNYNYRSCEDILEAVKPLLNDHDCILTLSDEIINIGNRNYVKATATIYMPDDKSLSVSASACEAETKKGMDPAQITGAASSYARKYALNGLFAIDDTKDADTQPPPLQQPKFTQPQKPEQPQVELITAEQAESLKKIATSKKNRNTVISLLAHYGVKKFEQLKAEDVVKVVKGLEGIQ